MQFTEIRRAADAGSIAGPGFDRLARYETHLDRKLERTLSMLLKLQHLRREREGAAIAVRRKGESGAAADS